MRSESPSARISPMAVWMNVPVTVYFLMLCLRSVIHFESDILIFLVCSFLNFLNFLNFLIGVAGC